jgi:hypothetical protein
MPVRYLTGFLLLASAGAAALACQSAVGLDVTYQPTAPLPSRVDGGASADAYVGASPDGGGSNPQGAELEGCPCDQTQGLSCCVSPVGPSFCTSDQSRCEKEKGAFYGCFGPDWTTESVCCWHGRGALASTAYAAACGDGGVEACTTKADCSHGLDCVTAVCGTTKIGACGIAPECPPGAR